MNNIQRTMKNLNFFFSLTNRVAWQRNGSLEKKTQLQQTEFADIIQRQEKEKKQRAE